VEAESCQLLLKLIAI